MPKGVGYGKDMAAKKSAGRSTARGKSAASKRGLPSQASATAKANAFGAKGKAMRKSK